MYSYKIKSLPKNTIEVTVFIPSEYLKKEKEKALERLRNNLSIEGFRKGKVPPEIAKKYLNENQILEEAVKKFIPDIYNEIIKKEDFKPIYNPKIDFVKAKDGEDWEIKILIPLKPAVNLKNYKKIIKELKEKEKKSDIWVPGKATQEKSKKKDDNLILNKILEVLIKHSEIEIPDLILDEELEKRLAYLVDDIRKIGLTTEAYLKSKNITIEELKSSYRKEIEDTYKLEFILSEIADQENIKVEPSDLEKIFENIKDGVQREEARRNSYYYASLLRKQKTIDYLMSL